MALFSRVQSTVMPLIGKKSQHVCYCKGTSTDPQDNTDSYTFHVSLNRTCVPIPNPESEAET